MEERKKKENLFIYVFLHLRERKHLRTFLEKKALRIRGILAYRNAEHSEHCTKEGTKKLKGDKTKEQKENGNAFTTPDNGL